MDSFHYECPMSTCDFQYTSLVELADFPWCPSEVHNKMTNFIEAASSRVPRHVAERKRSPHRKTGGNWIKENPDE